MAGVSFVIVCFNHARYIERVTHHLAQQSGIEDSEFIFIDDGSDDGTSDAIRRATQGWPNTVIHQQENAGPSNALNQGISKATKPFIKLVGGDDLLHPQATQFLLKKIEDHSAVYAFGELSNFDPAHELSDEQYFNDLMPQKSQPRHTVIEDALGFMIRSMPFNPSCLLLRADVVKKTGGSDENVFVEDYSLSLRMATQGKFVQLPETVAYAPQGDEKRLSMNGAQTLHDANLALAGLIRDYPNLEKKYKRLIAKRAAGRAWLWARREGGRSVLSQAYLNFVLANSGLQTATNSFMKNCCQPFRQTNTIRLPKG